MRWFLCIWTFGVGGISSPTPLCFSWKVLWSPDGFLSTAWEETLRSLLQRPQPSVPGSLCHACSPAESCRKTEAWNQSKQAGKFPPPEILQTGTSLKTSGFPHGSCTRAMNKLRPQLRGIEVWLKFRIQCSVSEMGVGVALKAHDCYLFLFLPGDISALN